MYENSRADANGEGFAESTVLTRMSPKRIRRKMRVAAGKSKTSLRHSRHVSSNIGNEGKREATFSRSAARLRCCHNGARIPGRRRGRSNARAETSRNFAANNEVLPSCRITKS